MTLEGRSRNFQSLSDLATMESVPENLTRPNRWRAPSRSSGRLETRLRHSFNIQLDTIPNRSDAAAHPRSQPPVRRAAIVVSFSVTTVRFAARESDGGEFSNALERGPWLFKTRAIVPSPRHQSQTFSNINEKFLTSICRASYFHTHSRQPTRILNEIFFFFNRSRT